jgi:protein-S-isoprenylcysteine O-methyltransferase
MGVLIQKALQAVAIWLVALVIIRWVRPRVLAVPQLWLLAAVGLVANLLQPAYSPFERQRTAADRWTAGQILWTVYAVQIMAVGELCLRRAPPPVDALTCVAFGAMLGGLALRTWAVATLGRWFTWNVEIQPGQQLVTTGPYRFIRHPSYSGPLLTFLAGCFLLRSYRAAAFAAIALPAAFLRRIHHEERLLRDTFPEYKEYAARTGMLWPRLR